MARKVQSARLRLDRPGTRAVQQKKPDVAFMQDHWRTLGTLPRQVNRAAGVASEATRPVSEEAACDRHLCADRVRGWGAARLKAPG